MVIDSTISCCSLEQYRWFVYFGLVSHQELLDAKLHIQCVQQVESDVSTTKYELGSGSFNIYSPKNLEVFTNTTGNNKGSTCVVEQFCSRNGKFIHNRWHCDNKRIVPIHWHRDGGSDEFPSLCKIKTCSPLAWMRDQSKDCSDGSNEASCTTN
ncbi:uncharacterized protein [Musca autumnalis]|uniref:uncharacterized protein n=1 Tax=Musca autumnalis TaxID=221902 RepID=UPI003CED21B4